VSILARRAAHLQEARDAIRLATGVDVAVFSADVRDADAVAKAVEAAGPVDVLVCNHGVFTPQELEKQDLEEVRLMVEVNLMGTFNLIKAALPPMKQRTKATGLPASIAIMSSQAGQIKAAKVWDGSSGGMKADDVAKKALDGIKSSRFIVPCNFEGTMLSIATAGLSPQSSFLTALAEVLGAGFMRFMGLCFQWNWFSSIENWHSKKKGM
ncbi:hypothetical protein GW17_00058295, partial [Ensete ventricosum]